MGKERKEGSMSDRDQPATEQVAEPHPHGMVRAKEEILREAIRRFNETHSDIDRDRVRLAHAEWARVAGAPTFQR